MSILSNCKIESGDRIYVRAIQDGVKVLEMTVSNVADMTQLIGEIRYAGHRLEGLAHLFIRNFSKGWSSERPMMFYGGVPTPRRQALRAALREASRDLGLGRPKERMLFPWETH